MLLWLVFFLVGLAPNIAFVILRDLGRVLTQNAMVNSPHVITLAWAAYVAFFVYARCLENGVPKAEAQDKALQLGIFAWLAFLPADFYSIAIAHTNPLMRDRVILYFIAAIKLASWWTLLLMFGRYYLLGADTVFANVATLFPSSRQSHAQKPPTEPQPPISSTTTPTSSTGEIKPHHP